MIELHPGADRVFARLYVLDYQIAAGVFDVVQQLGRGIDPALVTHEADGAFAVDVNASGGAKAGFKRVAHVWSSNVVFA